MDAAAHRFPFERNSYRRYIRRGISSLTRLRGGETKVDEEGGKVGVDRESKVSNSRRARLILSLSANSREIPPISSLPPLFLPLSRHRFFPLLSPLSLPQSSLCIFFSPSSSHHGVEISPNGAAVERKTPGRILIKSASFNYSAIDSRRNLLSSTGCIGSSAQRTQPLPRPRCHSSFDSAILPPPFNPFPSTRNFDIIPRRYRLRDTFVSPRGRLRFSYERVARTFVRGGRMEPDRAKGERERERRSPLRGTKRSIKLA